MTTSAKRISSTSTSRSATTEMTDHHDQSNTELGFDCFQKLTVELQLLTWRQAAISVQIVKIIGTSSGQRARNNNTRALFLTCYNAREAVKKYCKPTMLGILPNPVYINPETNVVAVADGLIQNLRDETKSLYCSRIGLHTIKNIAICKTGICKIFNFDSVQLLDLCLY